MKKPRYSPSGLGMLSRCGVQYEYRYVEKIREPPAAAPLGGRAVHGGIETNLRHRQHEGVEAPREMVAEAVVDRLRDDFADADEQHGGVLFNEDEIEFGTDKVQGILLDRSVALAELHRTAVAPDLRLLEPYERNGKAVTGIEQSISIDAGPFDIMAVLDVMTSDNELRDCKTKIRTAGQRARRRPTRWGGSTMSSTAAISRGSKGVRCPAAAFPTTRRCTTPWRSIGRTTGWPAGRGCSHS